jgi:4-hydroxy-tetrahydrodipicolinate synthase
MERRVSCFAYSFYSGRSVRYPTFEKNLQAQMDAGVSGVIIGGSLGEASTITSDEKEKW